MDVISNTLDLDMQFRKLSICLSLEVGLLLSKLDFLLEKLCCVLLGLLLLPNTLLYSVDLGSCSKVTSFAENW
jgi:hypothetical protein